MFLTLLCRLIALSEDLVFFWNDMKILSFKFAEVNKTLIISCFYLILFLTPCGISEYILNCSVFTVRRKILSILDSIDFSQDIPEPLQLDFFDRVQIEQVIANCEHKNARGQVVCNVKVRSLSTQTVSAIYILIIINFF